VLEFFFLLGWTCMGTRDSGGMEIQAVHAVG